MYTLLDGGGGGGGGGGVEKKKQTYLSSLVLAFSAFLLWMNSIRMRLFLNPFPLLLR